MIKLEEAQQLIEQEISKLDLNLDPANLYEPISYILSLGGKRLRPSMLLMGCSMFGSSVDPAISPAMGIEIFHNFTLLHDDIMDNAKLRRHKETVHSKWNTNIAILSGDAMSILAYQYLTAAPENVLRKVLSVFGKTALEVCEGQQYDMNYESIVKVSESEYLRMIELKTSVLLAASLKIGALIGGSSESEADKLYDFGRFAGLAFQLQDDLLDTFGDEAVFGKSIGGDIRANKKTYLLIKALEKSDEKDQAKLFQLLNDKEIDAAEKVSIITDLYKKYDIEAQTRQKIDYYFNNSLQALGGLHVDEKEKEVLEELAFKLVVRSK
jgi:geranylgeranyl diphosphate synthase type II